MPLQSLSPKRRRLAEDVYDQLVQAIVTREIGPEDRLVQEKLAAELEISRTPVREALLRLEKEGVLRVAPSGGFRLSKISEEETRDLYQARIGIEGQAARLLATRADVGVLDRLRHQIANSEALTDPTTYDYFVANRTIHRALVEAARNRFLLDMFDMIWGRAMAFHLFAAIENTAIEDSLGDHLALVEAVASADPARAFEAFARHIDAGFTLHLDGIRRSP